MKNIENLKRVKVQPGDKNVKYKGKIRQEDNLSQILTGAPKRVTDLSTFLIL
jgi:hypothetical protein